MNVRLIAFLTASLTAHAGLLLWQPEKTPITLAIGGQAQALSVTVINRVQTVIQQQVFAKPEPAKKTSHPSKHAPTETPTPETSTSRPRSSTRTNAITTQRLLRVPLAGAQTWLAGAGHLVTTGRRQRQPESLANIHDIGSCCTRSFRTQSSQRNSTLT